MSFTTEMINFAHCMAVECKKIAVLLLLLIGLMPVSVSANGRFVLVIDAGHGGRDAGAVGRYTKEKDINLNVALAFGRLVQSNCPDVKVVYTRSTDKFIPLYERARIANRNKADLFVSIHTNALPKGRKAMGMETYTLGMHRAAANLEVAKRENSVILIENNYQQHYEGFDPNSAESYIIFELMQSKNMEKSVDMAQLVQKYACAATGRNNMGVKQAGFLVLRETSMPSCLIELGFISTPSEEKYLRSKTGVEAYGRGIYRAFMEYRRQLKPAGTVIRVPETQPVAQQQVTSKPQTVTPKPQPVVQATPKQPVKVATEVKQPEPAVRQDGGSITENAPKFVAAEVASQPTETRPQQSAADTVKTVDGEKPVSVEVQAPKAPTVDATPVFKVQILSLSVRQSQESKVFKGLQNVECYEEGGLYKYTCGASTDYNEIYRLRKTIAQKFPQAFIIAFKGGVKVNVNEAIREFKQNRNK